MNDYLLLVLGVICAAVGGELFVRGAIGIAGRLRVSPGIIGATLAGFATSAPEISVAINASLAQDPQIALGDALGSNIVNIALILGLSLALSGIRSTRKSVKRDFPIALIAPVVIGFLALDGLLSASDGLVLLVIFSAWLYASYREAKRQRSAAEEILGEKHPSHALAAGVGGLSLLVLAGRLIVKGGEGIALSYGIDEFLIGALLVALGTSTPELATILISKLRKNDEVALGTILGSNIFNGFFIVAIAALIFPIRIDPKEVSVTLLLGLLTVAVTYPDRKGRIARKRGFILLALYFIYILLLL